MTTASGQATDPFHVRPVHAATGTIRAAAASAAAGLHTVKAANRKNAVHTNTGTFGIRVIENNRSVKIEAAAAHNNRRPASRRVELIATAGGRMRATDSDTRDPRGLRRKK